MHVHESDFRIRKECLSEALRALKEAAGKGNVDNRRTTWDWCDMTRIREADTLQEGMRACRWDLCFDDDGNVFGIVFEREKLGDESQIFDALAPWLEDESYIELVGEDSTRWRWVFNNGQMKEIEATISWEEPED